MEWWMNPAARAAAGAPAGMPALARAVPGMEQILAALERAQYDLSLQCAVSSVGHYIPAMRRLPGFEQLHRENYDVSYHLTTAIGSARRILAGAREPGYFALLVSCQREARAHQQEAMEAYRQLAAAAPAELRPVVQRLGGLVQATAGHMERSMGLTVAALGREHLERLVQWSRQSEHD